MSGSESPPASPAAERNKGPILEILARMLPAKGAVLEIASGTGQHLVHFAAALAGLEWQPSDSDPARCTMIATRIARAGLTNARAPLALDVHERPWPIAAPFDAIVCINMIHIAPASATAALLAGAAQVLKPAGLLYLYGPFLEGGRHTAASNEAFDQKLRADNPAWGVRDLDAVSALAAKLGFGEPLVEQMPVNNLSVIYRRQA